MRIIISTILWFPITSFLTGILSYGLHWIAFSWWTALLLAFITGAVIEFLEKHG